MVDSLKHRKILRLWHHLTAYHLRDKLNKKQPYILAICSCGYKARWFRKMSAPKWRRIICIIMGHKWGKPYDIHEGPIDFEESENHFLKWMIQCDFCFKSKTLEGTYENGPILND